MGSYETRLFQREWADARGAFVVTGEDAAKTLGSNASHASATQRITSARSCPSRGRRST